MHTFDDRDRAYFTKSNFVVKSIKGLHICDGYESEFEIHRNKRPIMTISTPPGLIMDLDDLPQPTLKQQNLPQLTYPG